MRSEDFLGNVTLRLDGRSYAETHRESISTQTAICVDEEGKPYPGTTVTRNQSDASGDTNSNYFVRLDLTQEGKYSLTVLQTIFVPLKETTIIRKQSCKDDTSSDTEPVHNVNFSPLITILPITGTLTDSNIISGVLETNIGPPDTFFPTSIRVEWSFNGIKDPKPPFE